MSPSKPSTKAQQQNLDDAVAMANMIKDVSYIKDDVREIKSSMSSGYVSKDEFEPIKKIVYGLVSLIMIGVVSALLALVVNHG